MYNLKFKTQNSKFNPRLLFLSILTGILMSESWLIEGCGLLSLIALIPLFIVDDFAFRNPTKISGLHYFYLIYTALLVWTLCSVWWLVNSTLWGLVIAVLFYPFYMTIPFLLSLMIKKKLGGVAGYFSLIVFWLSFEWLTLRFDFAWPWLLLGNAFGRSVCFVQWYDCTGLLGGTLWILLLNILLFQCWKQRFKKHVRNGLFIVVSCLVLFPISYSLFDYSYYRFNRIVEKGHQSEYIIVQPNINPYTEKFSGMTASLQIQKMLSLSDSLVTEYTSILVLPETAIPEAVEEETIGNNPEIQLLQAFIRKHPSVTIIAGAITHRLYNYNRDEFQNYHCLKGKTGNYVTYNAALCITKDCISITRKSKLLPGVETMPFARYIPIIATFFFDFGGEAGSFGTQTERTVFKTQKDTLAVIICYEAEFGGYMAGFIRNGAQSLCSITNDGWWGDTPGYKQHLSFCRLRAIELRRDIARSANTGVSCLIDQRGDVTNAVSYGKSDCKRIVVHSESQLTFYAKYGDYLGEIAFLLSLVILMIGFLTRKPYNTGC